MGQMKTCTSYFRDRSEIWIFVILISASTLAALFAVKNIIISTDSITYGLISQQIIAGNGIRIPVIGVIEFDNMVPVNGTVPYLTQPPLLSTLLAIFGGIAPHDYLSGQIVNVICHVIISIFTFLLMKKIYDKTIIALLTGLLVSFSYPMLWNTHHLISETLFIALIVAAIYFLVLSRHSDHHQCNRSIVAAGIFASAAILARYAGIALIAVFFLEAIILIKNKKIQYQYKSIILATAMPIITFLSLFTRNYILLGTTRGINLPAPERSYLEALAGTIKMLYMQFQLGEKTGILLIILMMLFIVYIAINSNVRRELLKYSRSGLDLLVFFIIIYTALIFITLAKDQPYYELRYMSPSAPFLFVLSIALIVFVWDQIKLMGFYKLSLIGLLLSLGIITFGTCYKAYSYVPDLRYHQQKLYSIVDSCTYNWMADNYGDDIVVTTNKPFRLSFFGGYSTLVLPSRKWIPNARIPENMKQALPKRMSEVGSQVLVLFDGINEQHYERYVTGLFSKREDNANFALVYECPDGVVYKLKE